MRAFNRSSHKHNSGEHIRRIMDTHACSLHNAPLGVPCFHIHPGAPQSEGAYLAAVCGVRIKKVGFTGKISDMAIRKTGYTKPNRR